MKAKQLNTLDGIKKVVATLEKLGSKEDQEEVLGFVSREVGRGNVATYSGAADDLEV